MQGVIPPATSFWQGKVLTDGEVDRVAGLIPSRTKGMAAMAWQLPPWRSERCGRKACIRAQHIPSVPKASDALHDVSGKEIRVLSSNPRLEIPFGCSLKWLGRNELVMWRGKTGMNLPQGTWVSPTGKHHGAHRAQGGGIISQSSGKVKWASSSSH